MYMKYVNIMFELNMAAITAPAIMMINLTARSAIPILHSTPWDSALALT